MAELWDKLSQTWPARAAQGLWEGLTLPGDVYQGNVSMYGEDGRTNPQVIDRANNLAGAVTLGAGAIPAEANSLRAGIKAYHGSPHDFDKFDLSKIGTGEGAQAYGHGLYFAENEGVARGYRDALKGKVSNPQRNENMRVLAQQMSEYEIPGTYRKYSDPRGYELANQYDELMAARAADKGKMYEVNINADPAHFLDWDKPLIEQGATGKRAFESIHDSPLLPPTNPEGAPNAGGWVRGMQGIRTPERFTSQLNEAGIPGIKYLDQGSRSAGQGSSNYVVFNDKLIDIMRKYGLAGATPLATGLGLSGQDQQR